MPLMSKKKQPFIIDHDLGDNPKPYDRDRKQRYFDGYSKPLKPPPFPSPMVAP
jgi:hypothetical protein